MSFPCEKCGACCRYHKCKYLTKDNLCGIYDKRPDRCNVDKLYEKSEKGKTKEDYYKIVKFACNLLRTREYMNQYVEIFFDKQYEQERINFRRENA